jgi:hypothetical protein
MYIVWVILFFCTIYRDGNGGKCLPSNLSRLEIAGPRISATTETLTESESGTRRGGNRVVRLTV